MRRQVRILAIGASALLEGIVICLEQDPSFTLQQVQTDDDDALTLFARFKPDAIIYQLGCPESERIMLLIPALPEIRVLALDAGRNQVRITECGTVEVHSFAEFQQLLLAPRIVYTGINFARQEEK